MSLLPNDLTSFAWGAALGGAAAFGTGFLEKAGEHAFHWLSRKVNPGEPEPTQVGGQFVTTRYAPADCAWVGEAEVYDYETRGYKHYPHPKKRGSCFRVVADGDRSRKEFLLVQPGAKPRPRT